MKANDIFISYSTKNSDIARAIRKLFQDHGITCWMAPESIPAGSNYTKEIPYGILYSKVAVLILSNASLDSVWVNHEIEYLLSADRVIIPFLIEDVIENPKHSEHPYNAIIEENSLLVQLEKSDSYQRLLSTVQHQLGRVSTAKIPDTSDDLLQLGLRDISEDGGMLFDNGKAEYYLTKSAKLGNVEAMRCLAELIYDIGDSKDAQIWSDKAAENGDIPSQIIQARRIIRDKGDNNVNALLDATVTLDNAVTNNNIEGTLLYAELLLNKDNPKYEPTVARTILENILNDGHLEAALLLGDIYSSGNGIEEHPIKAYEYYSMASKSDDIQLATLKLGDCYFYGYGTPRDYYKAFSCYADFCYYSDEYIEKYADCWYYGYGTHIDKKKALDLYSMIFISDEVADIKSSTTQTRILKKRFELGDSDVKKIMADIKYADGLYEEAYILYKEASEENAEALLGLAICLLNGHGVHYDYKEAFKLLIKSYSQKCKKAATYLAQCYEFGIGTAKNISLANYFKEVDGQGEHGTWSLSYLN